MALMQVEIPDTVSELLRDFVHKHKTTKKEAVANAITFYITEKDKPTCPKN